MKQYAVSEQLVNAILKYLGSKPYIEVAALINAIGQSKEVVQSIPVPSVSPEPKET